MKTYAVILRGVMPSGKNKVPMARLREVLVNAGFADAQTWIQSGNIALSSGLAPATLEARVQSLIKEHIGPDLAVVARTGQQLRKTLSGNPFHHLDQSRVFYTFFKKPPAAKDLRALGEKDFGDDAIALAKDGAYLHIPGNAARSKLSNAAIEKELGIPATTRNGNTVRKMIELCGL
ncbi:MAG: DUF1697 domain-containing protein [Nitrospinae bacterium]|nr:DUF1697 domain-containing protein [Nitrospinota bacterium]